MSEPDANLIWGLEELALAMQGLARAARMASRIAEVPRPPKALASMPPNILNRWVERAAARMDLEAEPVQCDYRQMETFLNQAGPVVLRLSDHRFLALMPGCRFLGRDLKLHKVPLDQAQHWLCRELEAPVEEESRAMLQRAGVPAGRIERAVQALLKERIGHRPAGFGWLIHLPQSASFWHHLTLEHIPRRVLLLFGVHLTLTLLWIVSWWIIGRAALQGHLDLAWLVTWALLLPTIVPFLLLGTWLQGHISLSVGALLKKRLLFGALRMDADEIRTMGSGQLLARVIESQAVEGLALSGGFLSIMAGIELLASGAVMAGGAGGGWQALLLVGWVGLTLGLSWHYYRRRRRWTASRLDLTQDLVESMVGQRTRLAQQMADLWHNDEDEKLETYTLDSQAMDRATVRLFAAIPRGFLIVGLLGLAPSFVTGLSARTALAVGMGGLILAFRALSRLTQGVSNIVDASIAWEQVAPLFNAAARPQEIGAPEFSVARDLAEADHESTDLAALLDLTMAPKVRTPSLLEAHDVSFRYGGRHQPVLRGVNASVERGDRILLGGRSGGGKSTLAALLCGVRQPEAGLMMLDGLDRQTVGQAGWRKSVVMAPQFHENHIIGATFLFNLLMGRHWPPELGDEEEALTVCRQLGLGRLLERMPGGLLQMVGECGWQLSHGERSRLFIARTLLQGADLIILDESFAALDPDNMKIAMQCVLDRAGTVIVIAHP